MTDIQDAIDAAAKALAREQLGTEEGWEAFRDDALATVLAFLAAIEAAVRR
jgi:hypothetical protein